MPTLSQLEADLYRRLGYASSPATEITTRVRAYLNETQRAILRDPAVRTLLHGSLTFDSVASTATYALPQAAATVKALRETTNDRRLEPRSDEWYRDVYPDPTAVTGVPAFYVDLGLTSIAKQPSDASEIFVDSTAAGDTGTAYLEGYRTGGYFFSESVTMTGTTAVSFNTAITDWVWLTKFYISAAAVGTVTLHEDASGGTELARIPIEQTFARYRRIALVPTPAAAVTYTVDFDYDVPAMANATDEPILPVRFHDLLGVGARLKEYEKKDDSRYREAKEEYEQGMRQLRLYCVQQAIGTANLQGHRRARVSRLGGWYPAGS